MAEVTRHALRVYAALTELSGNKDGDILGALIPFFEPILTLMHGRIFDPQLLATGARKLYGWRINRDIVEQFIPKLVQRNYLRRGGGKHAAFYVVEYESPKEPPNVTAISEILIAIVDEFQRFPPRVTDL